MIKLFFIDCKDSMSPKTSNFVGYSVGSTNPKTKKALEEISKSLVIFLVAGEGFEPTTFGL